MDTPAVPIPTPIPNARTITKKKTKLLRSPPQNLKIHRKEEVEEGYRNSTLPQQSCIISGDTNPKFNNPPPKNPPQGSGGGLHKFHSLAKIEFQEIQCPDDYDGVVIESSTPPKGALILNLLNFSLARIRSAQFRLPCKNTLQTLIASSWDNSFRLFFALHALFHILRGSSPIPPPLLHMEVISIPLTL